MLATEYVSPPWKGKIHVGLTVGTRTIQLDEAEATGAMEVTRVSVASTKRARLQIDIRVVLPIIEQRRCKPNSQLL